MRLPTLPLLLALAWPVTVSAQAMVQALPGSSDADLLAATMRRVAANPLDLDALLTAGEQSLKVDDLAGAASLFARAEKIDPRSGRVKAGMASILVRSERPGEALRYFAQAEAAGLDPRRFAADRGFAYDLTGDQPRAQADYRVALATGGTDDETVRRYALSLGISGQVDEAQRQLQPLLGRSDRAAWRARAFILAMGGDQAGAEKIAVTMMPGGMAQGLRPFFERLPTLPAADRAFAVHFGEVRPTPERLADARLAPVLPPLPTAAAPVQVAAVAARVRPESRSERRRRERDERRAARDRVALASRTGRVTLPAATSIPAAAAVVTAPVQIAALAPTPTPVPVAMTSAQPLSSAGSPVAVRSITPEPNPVIAATTAGTANSGSVTPGVPPVGMASLAVDTAPVRPGFSQSVTLAATPGMAASPGGQGGLAPLVAPVSAVAPPIASAVTAAPARPTGGVALAAVGGASQVAPGSARTVARRTPPPRTPAADSVLARIVASLSIPASELGVVQPARTQSATGTTTEGAARTAEALRTKAARDAEADAVAQRLVRGRGTDGRTRARGGAGLTDVASVDPASAARPTRTGRRGTAADTADDAEAATPKRADPKKALADRKAAAEKKAAADKAAEEKRAARSNPSRIWVQVAGGAYEGDLPKAWAATRAKAPDAFAGRAGYSAKLRATNRVVTGPFKTDAEARAFVNRLAKAGVSAFPFTSDSGETVTRLPGK